MGSRNTGSAPLISRDSLTIEAGPLDRGRVARWITGAALSVLVAAVAACSGSVEDDDSSAAAASNGRWTLPSDVKAAGAKVRLVYDPAPKWTTAAACGGKLRPGGRILGELLMDSFGTISSVGGYACRRNTADVGRMSVHGTGRALDVFIPMVAGKPNPKGDKVANWLVRNAQAAGVQLVIWDRSMWRSNGTNDVPYGGPVPHIDHLHVELTEEAAANTALWFEPTDADDGTDAGSMTADAGTDDGSTADDGSADASTVPDASSPPPDASSPPPDASTPPPDASSPPPDAAPESDAAPDVDSGAEAPVPEGEETGDYGESSADDESGEENSLPSRPTRHGADDSPTIANAGCSTSSGTSSPLGTAGTALAIAAVGLGARRRRRRR
ncbi:MAG: hypothetical protein JWP97_3243 [Labilithrix sp.]|nr:hypothetical protein [Labilithrix sp.]